MTESKRMQQLLTQQRTFLKPPFYGTTEVDLEHGIAGFEFWHDTHESLYVAVCIPSESELLNGLFALIDHLESKIFYRIDDNPPPLEIRSALIVHSQFKTKVPDDFQVFVLPAEYKLLTDLGEK
jgi:hypothetical protein